MFFEGGGLLQPCGWVLNSSSPSAAYMRQWIGSALVQIMACHLFGAKPLSKPMLGYKQTSVTFQSKYKTFNCIWKYCESSLQWVIPSLKGPLGLAGGNRYHWITIPILRLASSWTAVTWQQFGIDGGSSYPWSQLIAGRVTWPQRINLIRL